MRLKTKEQVKLEFERSGLSIAEWAVAHGVSPNIVYLVLGGKRRAVRGQSHRIAVLLGLKKGKVVEDSDAGAAG